MNVACLWFAEPTDLEKVAELLLRLSPQICIRSGQAIFIEIGKCKNLYSPLTFYKRILVILNSIGLRASIGFGQDITDSLLRAQYQVQELQSLPLIALLEWVDPFNKDVIIRKYVEKMIKSLTELGIKNIQQFQTIPTSDLISRFGPSSLLCKQRVSLEIPITWSYWKPIEIISERSSFPYFEFYGELEPILFELKKQLDSIYKRLWLRCLKAQKMQVRIYCESNSQNPEPFRQFDFDFLFALSETKGTLKIMHERLARDFTKKPILSPIEAVQTTVLKTAPGTEGQKNLLHRHEEIIEQKQALMAQLIEIHGKDQVFQAQLVEDRRPERSWTKVPESSWKKTADEKMKDSELIKQIPLRPTHIMRPEQIEVTAGMVHIRKKAYRILQWPKDVERITGGWQKTPYDRNYYILELENGVKISVFQDQNQKFFLHGYFG